MKKSWSPLGSTKGVLKFTVNWTSRPVTGPSPKVFWLGDLLIPLRTEFWAVKLVAMGDVVNVRLPALLSRSSNWISEGELARVGTLGCLTVFESKGKTR